MSKPKKYTRDDLMARGDIDLMPESYDSFPESFKIKYIKAMPLGIPRKVFLDATRVINWGELSRRLCNNRGSLRANRIPKKHERAVASLTMLISDWLEKNARIEINIENISYKNTKKKKSRDERSSDKGGVAEGDRDAARAGQKNGDESDAGVREGRRPDGRPASAI